FLSTIPAPTAIATLSLHDALPISDGFVSPFGPWVPALFRAFRAPVCGSLNIRGLDTTCAFCGAASGTLITSMRNSAVFGSLSGRSEEHTSELQSRGHLVCRLLLEK